MKLTLVTDGGPKTVDATIFGPLAVHATLGRSGMWNVTHVATGLAIAVGLTEEAATEIAEAVAEKHGEALAAITEKPDAEATKELRDDVVRLTREIRQRHECRSCGGYGSTEMECDLGHYHDERCATCGGSGKGTE